MIFTTKRLILRPWEESDAQSLFRYASDPDVGPIAGWPPHQSVEQSLDVIRHVFNGDECYAICKRNSHEAIGAIELKLNGHTDMTERDDECELGYWLAKPYWGRGYMPEAGRELIRHAFEDLDMKTIWCGYYDGNTKSSPKLSIISGRSSPMLTCPQIAGMYSSASSGFMSIFLIRNVFSLR